MNAVPQIIKQALIEKQSFKIENLGYFTVNYVSAQIHPILHSFDPPKYEILFSKEPINTTLTFEKYAAQVLKISEEEARQQIKAFTDEIYNTLKTTPNFVIDHVGEFRMDNDLLTFSADNLEELNEEFLGLDSFTMPVVKTKSSKKEAKKQKIDKKDSKKEEQKEPRKKSHKKLIWWIIILLFVGSCTTLGYIYRDQLKAQWEKLSIKLIKNNEEVILKSENKDVQPVQTEAVDTIVAEEPTSAEPTSAPSQSVSQKTKYYLIAGCFKSEENAQKLITKLKKEGFSPIIAGKNAQGLYRVATSSGYQTEAEALTQKEKHPTYWILEE